MSDNVEMIIFTDFIRIEVVNLLPSITAANANPSRRIKTNTDFILKSEMERASIKPVFIRQPSAVA